MKPALAVTLVFLSLVALLHLVRLLVAVEVTVDGAIIPVWVSLFGCIGPGALAAWLWWEQRPTRTTAT